MIQRYLLLKISFGLYYDTLYTCLCLLVQSHLSSHSWGYWWANQEWQYRCSSSSFKHQDNFLMLLLIIENDKWHLIYNNITERPTTFYYTYIILLLILFKYTKHIFIFIWHINTYIPILYLIIINAFSSL